ncbi:MAG: hypothetical protein V7L14_27815 [Nostoc sp.]|uniref:hypothetical protein n=1 Tax=Nostoc sp. TaxID=1180 RepID=UPI002FF7F712
METAPKLTFKYGWDERDEVETPMKGCRSDGIVCCGDGKSYCVSLFRQGQIYEAIALQYFNAILQSGLTH